jgi:AmmeMemoRadiSam system protein A
MAKEPNGIPTSTPRAAANCFLMTKNSSPDPVSWPDRPPSRLNSKEREALRKVAWRSIDFGLETGKRLEVTGEGYPPPLREGGATFVTLEMGGRLRGCIGTYHPRRPLVRDVAENAFAAAFRDHRFPPVSKSEREELELHISLLSPLAALEVESEVELLGALRPGVDGLLLEDPPHRSTFLPQVWDSLTEPLEFLTQLKLKAGLPVDHWSSTVRFYRYTVEGF